MPKARTPKRLFISHSHREPEVAAAFDSLATTAIEGLTDGDVRRTTSPETGILPGQYITPELIADIHNCHSFVALVSEAYLNSDYCLMEYAAWLGAGKDPMALRLPGVDPEDLPGMMKGAKLGDLTQVRQVQNALVQIAKQGGQSGWSLRDEAKFKPQLQALIDVATKPRPRRWMAQKLLTPYEDGEYLNAYGLDQGPRSSAVIQDFSGTTHPVQFLWTDLGAENSISCRLEARKGLLISFKRGSGAMGCNVSIRPDRNQPVLTKGCRSLCIEARVAAKSAMDEIGVIVRIVNGYMQHWRLQADSDNRKHLVFRKGPFQRREADLERDHWVLFPMDGTYDRGPDYCDFSVIMSVNLDVGSARGGRGDVGGGNGKLCVNRIWLE